MKKFFLIFNLFLSFICTSNVQVSVKNQNNKKLIALLSSSLYEFSELKSLLASKEYDINAKDESGRTLFMLACMHGYVTVIGELLKYSPDMHELDSKGKTALIWASFYGHYEIVEILIKFGMDINIKDNNGLSALDHACLQNHSDVVMVLMQNKAKINYSIFKSFNKEIQELLENKNACTIL